VDINSTGTESEEKGKIRKRQLHFEASWPTAICSSINTSGRRNPVRKRRKRKNNGKISFCLPYTTNRLKNVAKSYINSYGRSI